MSIHEPSRFKRFMNGKGYYIALSVALLSVVGAGVATFGEAIFVKESSEPSPSSQVRPVEQIVTGLPDDRKTTATMTTTTTTVATTTTTQAADLFILPFGNAVGKAYSEGKPAYSLTMGDWRVHNGTDFIGEAGGIVKALADGKVVAVEESAMWGPMVTVDHGVGVVSRYCGVKAAVKAGDSVTVGSTIGTLVTIPCEAADAPHLHLEMTVDGKPVNPVNAIGLEVREVTEPTVEKSE